MRDWRLRLRPLGWFGVFVGGVGTVVVQVAARRGDWGLVAAGAVLVLVGAATILRGLRTP